jgi:hypothetical protein
LALAADDRGKEKTLETLIEEAARARRCAAVLYGDSAADALEEYADELEAEIRRRAVDGLGDLDDARR